MTNKEAHQTLDAFKQLCELFNQDGFLKERSLAVLRAYQESAQQAFRLFKYLDKEEPCVATKAYTIACGKILIRLSSLIESGRKETDDEFRRWISWY